MQQHPPCGLKPSRMVAMRTAQAERQVSSLSSWRPGPPGGPLRAAAGSGRHANTTERTPPAAVAASLVQAAGGGSGGGQAAAEPVRLAPNQLQPIASVEAAAAAEAAAAQAAAALPPSLRRYQPTPGADVRRAKQELPLVQYDPAAAGGHACVYVGGWVTPCCLEHGAGEAAEPASAKAALSATLFQACRRPSAAPSRTTHLQRRTSGSTRCWWPSGWPKWGPTCCALPRRWSPRRSTRRSWACERRQA